MKSRKIIGFLATTLMLGLSNSLLSEDKTFIGNVTAATFKNPPNEYRITQYQLTPNTLKTYPQYGIGGTMAFFYSILYPECGKKNYKLTDRGLKVIGDLVKAAKDIDFKVWLADDWGYPSGMAGGRVVAENSDFEVKSLTMHSIQGYGDQDMEFVLPQNLHDVVYSMIYPLKNGEIIKEKGKQLEDNVRRFEFKGLGGNWELQVFARYVRNKNTQAQSTMKQFGHAGRYPDLMNKAAIGRFIANMHAPILAQIDDPSTQVEGFYCNEPNLMQTHWTRESDAPYACAPWSDGLPEQFKKMHGYEIFTILPAIFEGDDNASRRARIHYRQAVAELLTDSFSKQIREWCNARGIKSSGHFLLNDNLAMHVQGYGDLMKFVSEFDVPALDIPIPNPNQYMNFRYQQSRFFSSVTSWKERAMTLMLLDPIIGGYGRSRLSPRLPLLFNSVNMASFHGINHFTSYLPFDVKTKKNVNGHLESSDGYTPQEYSYLNAYTGRLTQVLRGARREATVGLYYPIAMFQADLIADKVFWPKISAKYRDRQGRWDAIEKTLLGADIEYMIVHPEGVASAEIIDGRIKIGTGVYNTLVMPELDFIPKSVSDQLRIFEANGGKVLWINQIPHGAEKIKNDSAVKANLKNAESISVRQLEKLMSNLRAEEQSLIFSYGKNKLSVGRFRKEDKKIYLLVNRGEKTTFVEVSGEIKDATLLNPEDGEMDTLEVPCKIKIGGLRSVILITDN